MRKGQYWWSIFPEIRKESFVVLAFLLLSIQLQLREKNVVWLIAWVAGDL